MIKWIKSLFNKKPNQALEYDAWLKEARKYNQWVMKQQELQEEQEQFKVHSIYATKKPSKNEYKAWIENCRHVDNVLAGLRNQLDKRRSHLRLVS